MMTLPPALLSTAKQVAQSKPNAILAVYATLDETCRWVSPSHTALLGFALEEMIGKPWRDMVAPEYHDHATLAGEDALLNGSSIQFSLEAISKAGVRIPLKGKAWIETDGGGPVDPTKSYLFFQATPRPLKP